MILIDTREEGHDKKKKNLDLVQHIVRQNVPVETTYLPFADAAIEINGPEGVALVGVERKRLHDMLNCVEDGRYNAQRIGMKLEYPVSILVIEGHWKPHDPEGFLMEGFQGGMTWGFMKPRGNRVLYAKLYRYLFSVALTGVIVQYTRDPFHTAFNLTEIHGWGQKRWDDHTALQEIQKFALPTLNRRPTLKQKWANAIEGIGVKKWPFVDRQFRSPLAMAQADEKEWLRIPGLGIRSAQRIVQEIWGNNYGKKT